MVTDNHSFLNIDFADIGLECVMVEVTCADGPNHIGYGRRQPIGPARNNTTQRGPRVTPVRREQTDRKGYVRRSR